MTYEQVKTDENSSQVLCKFLDAKERRQNRDLSTKYSEKQNLFYGEWRDCI